MVTNMWKNSLKNVESDNNKILYKTLLNFFYSETVLTFWISLVYVGDASLQHYRPSNWVWLRLDIKQNHWSILKKKLYFIPM